MVKLIQIDRLNSRIDGMLYKITFQEQWSLLDDVRGLFMTFDTSTQGLSNRVRESFRMLESHYWVPRTSRSCSMCVLLLVLVKFGFR